MKFHSVSIDPLSTETIELPAELASKLKSEAKKSHVSIPELLMQWLEDQADGREAAAVMKRIKSGKERAIPAAEVYARLGI